MKKLFSKKLFFFAFLFLLIIPFRSFCQDITQNDSSKIILYTVAREIMHESASCALITLDEEGRPRVRAMDPFNPESDFTVWFGTNPKSRKVDQIRKDPRVTIYYLDGNASGYVMMYGTAQLIDDQEEKEKRWKDEWEAFYTNKTDEYLLIKVTPIWLEVSSPPRGIYSDTLTWQPPVVFFDSEE